MMILLLVGFGVHPFGCPLDASPDFRVGLLRRNLKKFSYGVLEGATFDASPDSRVGPWGHCSGRCGKYK